jgi:hypothetical protein
VVAFFNRVLDAILLTAILAAIFAIFGMVFYLCYSLL